MYSGIVFDMDGTLTVSNIDYAKMRRSVGIPVGDLFTVMESWDDGDRIQRRCEQGVCADVGGGGAGVGLWWIESATEPRGVIVCD